MKRLMILEAMVVLAIPAYGGVMIQWQQHHVYGEAPWVSPEIYDITDNVPVSGQVPNGAGSSAGNFRVSAETYQDNGRAEASSTYIFTIDQPFLGLSLDGYLWSQAFPDIWGHVGYSLADSETGEIIYTTEGIIGDQSWSLSEEDGVGSAWELQIDETPGFILDIDRQYTLHLSASVTNADGTYAVLDVTVIPEPATLCLLTLGAVLAGRKRRK